MRMRTVVAVIALLWGTAALGQPIVVADSGDSAWMLTAAVLVTIAALAGLPAFYDLTRSAASALIMAAALCAVLMAIIGYSIGFSGDSPALGDAANVMLRNFADLHAGTTISESAFALFQIALASLAVCILVAPIAAFAPVGWSIPFAGLWVLLVYAPVAHGLWGNGWLARLGAIDFAGGLVVQLTAGAGSLVVALLLGRKRQSAIDEPHGGPIGLLWIGQFGVIGGAALSAGDDAATAILNAHLAASAAALAIAVIDLLKGRALSAERIGVAALAGLASAYAGAAYMGAEGAMILGVIVGILAALALALARASGMAQSANAFVAHGCGGLIGALLFPMFVLPQLGGPGFDADISLGVQVAAQAVAVVAVTLWTVVATTVAALAVSVVMPMKGPTD